MIPPQLVKAFPPHIQVRGDEYVGKGLVNLESANRHTIVGSANGTDHYILSISASIGEIDLSCTCPYDAPCKHLWGLLSIADETGALAKLLDTSGPRTRYSFSDVSNASDEDEEILLDDGSEQRRQQAVAAAPVVPQQPARLSPTVRLDRPAPPPEWKGVLTMASWQMRAEQGDPGDGRVDEHREWPEDRRLVYIVDFDASKRQAGIHVNVGTEKRDRDGVWGVAKKMGNPSALWFTAPDPADRAIREMLLGSSGEWMGALGVPHGGFSIRKRAFDTTFRAICDTGRCRTRSADESMRGHTLRWDDGDPWSFTLRLKRDDTGQYVLDAVVQRGTQELPITAPQFMHVEGLMVHADDVARVDFHGMFAFADALRTAPLVVGNDPTEFLDHLYRLPMPPVLNMPDDLVVTESDAPPTPMLGITRGPSMYRQAPSRLSLQFRYGATVVPSSSTAAVAYDRRTNTLFTRRPDVEQAAYERLKTLGMREEWNYDSRAKSMVMTLSRVPRVAAILTAEGWHVEADGVSYRWPGAIRASVRSGIDWFDLHGTVDFGTTTASLARVLDAYHRQDGLVELDDGAIGFVPVDELTRMGLLLSAGQRVDNAVRFQRSQLALLDILLEALPTVDVDETLARARIELAGFDRITAEDAPSGFHGVLRDYQREGLAWFRFLRRFDLGGCLADDMGLGKTVQVLAMLEQRRQEQAGMSLVVVPRSLVYNWIREAERFTPALRVLDFSGPVRKAETLDVDTADVVITTYGTIRRDAARLRDRQFDYVILDEAQAIKNADTVTAKACRLLNGRHRLALSGTPIENRIEELWSLFEFLNPGMLGASTRFATAARSTAFEGEITDGDTPEQMTMLARALRPVILRRKKSMVARELPARIEQTLDVTLEPKQRAFYEKLRRGYQASILKQVDQNGIQKSRMHILEALLRLRQAACHPVLADPLKGALPSAKLDALIPALAEIAAEGNKALVFSQFTSFLALVRERLDAEGIVYEYLDGRTKNRQEKVDRFQTDTACPVFLISLKAGGHGLNLTSAEYVYLLDPWWNPAVEAQAIDRAHRIGQTRKVIATRLVARDTIESKILQLQDSKRQLADAILTEDKGALASIGKAELELLLS